MREIKLLPVLYACTGCAQFGYGAPRVASALDGRGVAEAVCLGTRPWTVTERYPIFTLEACDRRCARDWVLASGASVQRTFVLEPHERDVPSAAADRIAALLCQ